MQPEFVTQLSPSNPHRLLTREVWVLVAMAVRSLSDSELAQIGGGLVLIALVVLGVFTMLGG